MMAGLLRAQDTAAIPMTRLERIELIRRCGTE